MSVTRAVKGLATAASAAAILGIGGLAMTTSSAAADPVGVLTVGGGVNKCYGEYFTNRWSSTCDKASQSGNYYTVATCANVGAKYGASVYVQRYTSLRGFSEGTCYPERVEYASTAVK